MEVRKSSYIFWLVAVLILGARVYELTQVPGGINQDEAFGAYEAWSLLNNGIDSNGHEFPVYLEVWGSGMSALNAYLMIPCLAIFGLNTFAVRIPAVIVGILTLFALYGIGKKLWDERTAKVIFLFVAISPWHIMMTRWGLDCNLAPGFLTFGLYFFLKGLEKPLFLLVSAFMYGLSLYCYAAIWPIVPIIITLEVGYALYCKKIKFSIELIGAGGILLLFAFPLLLFILVNRGSIPPISLGFLSIPEMAYFRENEISLSNMRQNFINLAKIIKNQNDGLIWNATEKYGIYYQFSTPFVIAGTLAFCIKAARTLWKKEYSPEIVILIYLFAGILLGLLVNVNINRVNTIFIPIMIVIAVCMVKLIDAIRIPKGLVFLGTIYGMAFLSFCCYYFKEYKEQISPWFAVGLEEALERAEKEEGTVYIDERISYPRLLFYLQIPVEEYRKTAVFEDYQNWNRRLREVGRYRFLATEEEGTDRMAVYVMGKDRVQAGFFDGMNMELEDYGNFTVAVPKKWDERGKECQEKMKRKQDS